MLRRRTIAAAPARDTSRTWSVMSALLVDTLERSPHIARADVEVALDRAAGVGRQLIAGGHLEREPIVLVAGDLYLEITTVSGDAALSVEENLNPVPGGASAREWMVHLPQCEPLTALVREAANNHDRLSAAAPPALAIDASLAEVAVNDDTLRRWAQEG